MWALENAADPESLLAEPVAGEVTERSVPWA
jgi:hypothetical protein